MQFLRGNSDDLQVEKDHLQKSDSFAMSEKWTADLFKADRRLIQSGPQTYSEIVSNTLEIHGVFGNVRGAADI